MSTFRPRSVGSSCDIDAELVRHTQLCHFDSKRKLSLLSRNVVSLTSHESSQPSEILVLTSSAAPLDFCSYHIQIYCISSVALPAISTETAPYWSECFKPENYSQRFLNKINVSPNLDHIKCQNESRLCNISLLYIMSGKKDFVGNCFSFSLKSKAFQLL